MIIVLLFKHTFYKILRFGGTLKEFRATPVEKYCISLWQTLAIIKNDLNYLERAFPVQSKQAYIFSHEVKVRQLCPKS